MNTALISLYELGRQPFGLASPAAWLTRAGATVTCQDLAIQKLDPHPIADASLVAIYLPMHTATRLAIPLIPRIKTLNPTAHICCYGIYAQLNQKFLLQQGVDTILSGEFEEGLVALYTQLQNSQVAPQKINLERIDAAPSLARQKFLPPDRSTLPSIEEYAHLVQSHPAGLDNQQAHLVGYTEASRGCKHLCRHCPIVPVYNGQFRIVQRDVVLADIRNQVAAGAIHITFGDPDFFNGPGHALPIVQALHAELPSITYDVTIKVEHLLQHARHLPTLKETGCLFITTAVEALDDTVLGHFAKGHTSADFIHAVHLLNKIDLAINPTFVTFHPWTTLSGYAKFLHTIAELKLIDHVAPIQYAIRLLITAASKLMELKEIEEFVEEFDEQALVYPWTHTDPAVDQLHADILKLVQKCEEREESRYQIFTKIWAQTQAAQKERTLVAPSVDLSNSLPPYTPHDPLPPRLSEPWYC